MDPKTDTCIGPNAAAAGALARRSYREPFVLPGWWIKRQTRDAAQAG